MANSGGGSVVFGVADKAIGKLKAIIRIDDEIDVAELQRSVFDNTEPHIIPSLIKTETFKFSRIERLLDVKG